MEIMKDGGIRGEGERRRRRCSRRMRGSRREMKLALGTMLMRKPNQALSRPTIGPAGDLVTSQSLLDLLSHCFLMLFRAMCFPDIISILQAGAV